MRGLFKVILAVSLFSSIAISNQNFDTRRGEIIDRIKISKKFFTF